MIKAMLLLWLSQWLTLPGPAITSTVGGGGTWTLTNYQTGSAINSPASVATSGFSTPLSPGSIIVAFVFSSDGNTGAMNAPSDSAGNTYADSGAGVVLLGGGGRLQVYLTKNTHSTSSNVVTETTSGLFFPTIIAREFTGSTAGTLVDTFGVCGGGPCADTGSGPDNMSIGSFTTTHDGDLLIGFFAAIHGTLSPGTTYTGDEVVSANHNLTQYVVQPTHGVTVQTGTDAYGFGQGYCAIGVALNH